MPRFCTALNNGRPCGRRALPGQAFCWGHHPAPYRQQPCAYFTRNGVPCRKLAMRGQDHCPTHSPRNHRAKHVAVPLIPRTPAQFEQAKALILKSMPQSPAAPPADPQTRSIPFSNMPQSPTTLRQAPQPEGLMLTPEILEMLFKALASNELPESGSGLLQPGGHQ